jgi:RNA polymerase sigma factor (sigma-70 family)
MNDWQLLQKYIEWDSDSAFRSLVNRYVNLVYSVALRQVRDAQLAEEVAQAVFILLARKARSFRPGVVLSGWLFRTTRFVASRAVRAEQRRQRREQEAFAMQQFNTPDDTWKRIAPALDEGLERLNEADRSALLLRFFNGQSHRETAAALGVSEDAAKKRVTRALDKLRHFFAKRGIALSAAALASAVTGNATQAATPEVALSVTTKVLAASSAAGGALPSLVNQTLSAWRWAKLKIAGSAGLAVLTAAFLISSLGPGEVNLESTSTTSETAGATEGQITRAAGVIPGETGVPTVTNSEETSGMLFRVVDAQTGTGIADAKVAVNYVSQVKWWAGDDLVTDAQGTCKVALPDGIGRLDVGVLKDGYVQKFYTWRKDSEEPLPLVYILKLEQGIAIGGQVRDEAGQPISGAEIVVNFGQRSDSTSREPQPERLGFIRDLAAAKSDPSGNWECAIIPPNLKQFTLTVSHPQFAAHMVGVDEDGLNNVAPLPRPTWADLLAGRAIIVLSSGFQVGGFVLDDFGWPLADAKVSVFSDAGFATKDVQTQADGSFQLTGLPAGQTRLGASAAGFAPATQSIEAQNHVSDLVFRLERGTTVSVRLVDQQDYPIAGAWIAAEGPQRHNADWWATSDADGWARIEGIPELLRSSLRFHAGGKDFFVSRDQRVDLLMAEPRLQLRRALKVLGRVVDAESGEPIAWFKAIPCRSEGIAGYDRSERKFGTNGNFAVNFGEFQPPFRVRIEADGYEPAMSAPIPFEPNEQTVAIKLQRQDPAKAIRGIVLRPDGQPAAGAHVALLTFERGATLHQGRFVTQGGYSILTATDAEGRFQFEPDANSHTVAVAHDAGSGRTRIRQENRTVVVQLAPWGRIEGQVRIRDGNWSGRDIALTSPHSEAGFSVSAQAKPDAEGRFQLEQIPAGDYTLHLNPGVGKSFTDATPVEVTAGETATTQIGGNGATVIGRLGFASSSAVDWVRQTKFPSLRPNNQAPPDPRPLPTVAGANNLAERRQRLDLVESDEWRVWVRSQRPNVTLKIAADGSFVGESVRAGEYTLHVELAAVTGDAAPQDPIASMMRPTIASFQQLVVVTEAQEQAGETVQLGVLELQAGARSPGAAQK